MNKKHLICILLLPLFGCTNEKVALEALQEARFHDVEITGYTMFSCSPSDFIHTEFKAKNPFGETVYGVVCSSPFSENPIIKF